MALNGFSTCNPGKVASYRVPGTTRSLSVRREIAPLLIGMAAEFHRLVEPITNRPLDDWGYACRLIRGRNRISFHAGGLAIDLNATRHPMGARGTFNARQRATIAVLCRKYGLRWGGGFSRPDEMHFEVILPRSAALALVATLQLPPRPRVRPPVAAPRRVKLAYGARNADVVLLQQRLTHLGYNPGPSDGIYGPATRAAVTAYQRAQGWFKGSGDDGLVGPLTLDRLF